MTKAKKTNSCSTKGSQVCLEKDHPDHGKELNRIKRVKGQLEGIIKMIESRKYCPDILIQIRAAKYATQAIEHSILKTHLENCVKEAIQEKNISNANKKIEELIKLIERHK